ncbi:MAG: YihY family inner membrane protein [Candidatus Brocadiaceae bacterium]|nr:YihY family inner membrane protein [Candidatus Brocadiaceae bacterium]
MRRKVGRVVRFLKGDVWRVRSRDLPPSRSFLIRQVRIVLLALRGFRTDRCSLRASALTYFTVLSIVPAVAMTFGVAKGFGLEAMLEERIRTALHGQPEVADHLIRFSQSLLESARGGVIAGVGIAVLFWTVIKVLTHVEKSFNAIWGVEEQRPLPRRFADYLSMMLIGPVLLIVSGGVTVLVAGKVQGFVQGVSLLGFLAPVVTRLLRLLPYCLGWGLFAFAYIVMPNTRVRFRSALLGGVVAGTLYQIVQWVYIAFQVGVAKYNAVYGSFAALPLFLVWLQLSWLIVLFGAELSFASQNVETYEFEPDCRLASRSSKRLVALRIVQVVVQRFAGGLNPLTAAEISRQVGVPIRLTTEILHELVEARVLSETPIENAKDLAHLPARPPEQLTIAFVLEALDDRGGDTLRPAESPELEELADSLRAFREELRRSPANTPLLRAAAGPDAARPAPPFAPRRPRQ